MQVLGWAVAASAAPVPTPTMTVPAESVTPGPLGFTVMALLVVVVFVIVWDMQRRIRRTRYRGEVNEELDREARDRARDEDQGAQARFSTAVDDQRTDAGDDPDESRPNQPLDGDTGEPPAPLGTGA